MEIRVADLSEREEITALYGRSQAATSLPDPAFTPPGELGERLYAREAVARYVAVEAGKVIGHALIEQPNPAHMSIWLNAVGNQETPLLEMGGAFVEPAYSGRGIWTALLLHRLKIIRQSQAIPVTGTWTTNEHVKRTFRRNGGREAGTQNMPYGRVALFVFW